VRDKDAAGAAMLLAELAAGLKSHGRTLHQELDRLYGLVGYHQEKTIGITLTGPGGTQTIHRIISDLRSRPPASLAGMKVRQVRDYGCGLITRTGGESAPLEGPRSDLVIFDLDPPGNRVAVRPSGTEPKLKIYLFAYRSPNESTDLERARADATQQIDAMESEFRVKARLEAK
jgi:phosphoglucomutase